MAQEPTREEREPVIRTMRTDAQELIQRDKLSRLDLYEKAAEARSRDGYFPNAPRPSRIPYIVGFAGLALVAGIGAGVYFYFGPASREKEKVAELNIPRPFISSPQAEIIKISPNDRTGLLSGIEKTRSAVDPREITYVPFAVREATPPGRLLTLGEFFEILEALPPADFLEGITGQWNAYMISGDMVFLIEIEDELKVRGALLRWDDTLLERLRPVMEPFEPVYHPFEDRIENNIDVRIAGLSSTNDAAVGYATVLGKILVIATSESSLRASIERLIAGPVNL